MVEVTNFLLRWLYLCNLIDNRADVQTWPHFRAGHYRDHQYHRESEHPHHQLLDGHPDHGGPPPAGHDDPSQRHAPPPPPPTHEPSSSSSPPTHDGPGYGSIGDDRAWKDGCIRSLTLWPPGVHRLHQLDDLRFRVVRKLADELGMADDVLRAHARRGGGWTDGGIPRPWGVPRSATAEQEPAWGAAGDDDVEDPYLDEDSGVLKELEELLLYSAEEGKVGGVGGGAVDGEQASDAPRARLIISEIGSAVVDDDGNGSGDEDGAVHVHEQDDARSAHCVGDSDGDGPFRGMTEEQIASRVADARRLLLEAREYLPQFVSAVLHSPPALTSELDPIAALRSLLVTRCLRDPALGIDLCWLLEAEVGRKWKALFEHRQQTGRRLILVGQADIVRAIAEIGAERQEAFRLLQDAEQATAFGTERFLEDGVGRDPPPPGDDAPPLPRAISDLRCNHFGDAMQFIDRLTQISLDLRLVPTLHRKAYLNDRLDDLNRRLCRRMMTRGQVSLDVEGDLGSPDWTAANVRRDMLQYSVHFPLEPKLAVWPGGVDETSPVTGSLPTSNGVVRVLNIIPDQCHVLASRERCPFLVRLEVVETGLEGGDPRLYSTGSRGIGVTVEEVVGTGVAASQRLSQRRPGGFSPCQIPPETLATPARATDEADLFIQDDMMHSTEHTTSRKSAAGSYNSARKASAPPTSTLPRGGWQHGEEEFLFPDGDYYNQHEVVQQQYFEQMHRELYSSQHQVQALSHSSAGVPGSSSMQRTPTVSRGSSLLDKVFGLPWANVCEERRQASPYGRVKGWRLASFIMKAGEDIRKEALVMQVISKMNKWFKEDIPEKQRPYLRPYTIMCVGGDAGLLECIPDAKSVDEVKKDTDGFTSLRDYFERAYGPPCPVRQSSPHPETNPKIYSPGQRDRPRRGGISFEKAQDNFLRSLVGYSLVCYVLQIKDRHNANILMDRDGHIMHIDFGFVLGETPKMGKLPLFDERAPFKLSAEFWEVLGGWSAFKTFCEMFEAAYACAASHSDEICSLIEAAVTNLTRDSEQARSLANGVRNRLRMKSDPKEQQMHIMDLVNAALRSWGTSTYDWLQRSMNCYQ